MKEGLNYISALMALVWGLGTDLIRRPGFASANNYSTADTVSKDSGISIKGYYSLDAFKAVVDKIAETVIPATVSDADYDRATTNPTQFGAYLQTLPDQDKANAVAFDMLSLIGISPASQETEKVDAIMAQNGALDNTPAVTFKTMPSQRGSKAGRARTICGKYGIATPYPTLTAASVMLDTSSVAIEMPAAESRSQRTGRGTRSNSNNVPDPTAKVDATIVAEFKAQPNAQQAAILFADKFKTELPLTATSVAKIADHVATLTVADLKN